MRGPVAPAAVAVSDRLFRALAVLRAVTLLNSVVLGLLRYDELARPALGLALLGFLVVWSGVVVLLLRRFSRRTPWVIGADLVVAAGLLLLTPVVKGPDFVTSLPGFWVMVPLLAAAARFGAGGGLAAAVVLVAADLAVRPEITQGNVGNVFLLLIGGPIVGYLCSSLESMAVRRDEAERAAAAAAERARLARAVHDGVLQVLAMVQRRGPDLGEEGARLGRLAGEQEASLRSLIARQDELRAPADGQATVDLTAPLADRVGRRPPQASLVGTGAAVPLPADVAAELVAAVGACLDNVARHVGEDAPAWVLLEDAAGAVTVTVRDAGGGIDDGRLAEAAAEGRMGVEESVRGRLAELGGTARLRTSASGTTWALTVPRVLL